MFRPELRFLSMAWNNYHINGTMSPVKEGPAMEKSKLNLIIDGLLLVCMAALAGIGLLMKYVLIPGFQRWEVYGRNVELSIWTLDRHGWGRIHYVLGLVLIVLIVLHVVLHWRMVVAIYQKTIPSRSVRVAIALILIIITVGLLTSWLFMSPQVQESGKQKGRDPARHSVLHTGTNRGAGGLFCRLHYAASLW